MMLLQTIAENTITWRTYLQDGYQIAQIIGTILIIIYVIYTCKTFSQIKKQTDYQQDAYLKREPLIIKEISIQDGGIMTLVDGRLIQAKNSLPTPTAVAGATRANSDPKM